MPLEARDDSGSVVRLPHAPERIVSLVPSLTELVCSLGAAERLVAVTRYCIEPAAVVERLPKVGGTKNPDCDAVLSFRPDLVLVNAEENRRADYDRLVAARVPVFVSFPTTVLAAADSIARLGALLERAEAACELARAIEVARAAVLGRSGVRPRVFCPIWRNPWMTFNRDTFAHDLISCAGAENVAADEPERYPRVDLATIAERAPEAILLPDEPYRFAERHLIDMHELADTPAWRAGRIHFVDGKAISWYGARTPGALRELTQLLMG